MRRAVSVAILVALALVVAASGVTHAQIKKDAKTGLDRIDGTVTSINKEKSTFSVRQSSGTAAVWNVAFTKDTKFTYRNGAGKMEDMKEGGRVIVLGKYEKDTLHAQRIDMRTGK